MSIADQLSGGDPRSLGRTDEVIELVLRDPRHFEELFGCLFDTSETVRMRASDALEKIARERHDLFEDYRERLLTDVAAIDQPSIQWHLAQILERISLDADERQRAIAILKCNLTSSDDWIVINTTMSSLAKFSHGDPQLRQWLLPHLRRFMKSDRKSIAKRAQKLLTELEQSR